MPGFSLEKPSEFTRECLGFVSVFCIGFNTNQGRTVRGCAMNLEPKHNQAIRQEIGEHLRLLLSEGPTEMPPRLRELVHCYGDDGEPPLRDAR